MSRAGQATLTVDRVVHVGCLAPRAVASGGCSCRLHRVVVNEEQLAVIKVLVNQDLRVRDGRGIRFRGCLIFLRLFLFNFHRANVHQLGSR